MQRDVFNSLLPGSIRTNKIRLSMRNSQQSTGIIEWRVWGSDSALPAHAYRLLAFSGTRTDGANQLQWETLSEDPAFITSWSMAPTVYISLRLQPSQKDSAHSYRVTHTSNSSNSYYRLRRSIHFRGSSLYSSVGEIRAVAEDLAMQATASTSYVSP